MPMEGVRSKESRLESKLVDWRGEGNEEGMLKGRGEGSLLPSSFSPSSGARIEISSCRPHSSPDGVLRSGPSGLQRKFSDGGSEENAKR